jgi:light-regulated signal transduction histidine kinase (bacteriophytochrome)
VNHFETIRVRKDGKLINISATISPIHDENGKIIGASKIARDITERKRAEQRIREINVELEHHVAKRTAQLEAANQELESFSYSISHDLRAPLRAMSGFARILEKEYASQLSAGAKQAVERIQQNAARMSQLIDGMLDFASLNWMPITKKKTTPEAIARTVFDELRPDAGNRRVDFEIDKLPPCMADASLLKQVYANLISNALKYSRNRDPAVIKIGCREEKGKYVYFVQDNGAGFDMKYANKLFRVFQRLHGPEQFEGTGVGLAIVQRIIERHGGRIWADAQVDGGATFHFTLGES